MTKNLEVLEREQAYRRGYNAGQHNARGGPRWFLLTLMSGGAYLLLRPPQRRTQLQEKFKAYSSAAREGTLAEVAQRDLSQVKNTVQQLRQKATKAVEVAKKGQQVSQVAAAGVEPATKLAEDAHTILSSDDPQQVGLAVQDAKARLAALAETGREVTRVMDGDGPSTGTTPAGPDKPDPM